MAAVRQRRPGPLLAQGVQARPVCVGRADRGL